MLCRNLHIQSLRSSKLVHNTTYPLDTNEAWYVLRALGYKADRKSFDYCVRHAHLEPPAKEGNRLLWTVDSVIDFGMAD